MYAADFGQVSDVGWENPNNEKQGFGFRIYVRLIDGNVDIYGHMDPGVMVSTGEPVAQGQYLGQYADPTNGTATGPHLHFERRDPMGNRIDTGPLNVVGTGGRVTSLFGPRTIRGKKGYHYGYDYIGPIIP